MVNSIKIGKKKIKSESIVGLIFILPTISIFLVFLYYPFFNGIRISFFEYTGIGAIDEFVGLENYFQILTDKHFLKSIINTIILIIVNIIVVYPISFILAYILYRRVPLSNIFQFLLFIPYLLSMVVVGTLFSIILDPTIGPLNNLLNSIGLERFAISWLGDKNTALYAVSLVGVWKVIPFYMLIIYSNLLKIPKELIEASEVDGASYFQQILYIIIPNILSTFNAILILIITGAFRFFDLIWIMTLGGPGGASEVTTTYIYRKAFQNNDFGYATALSIFIIVIIMGLLLFNNFVIYKRFKKNA